MDIGLERNWRRSVHYYHGGDIGSASALLRGEPLDAGRAASLKLDGPAGFFLARERTDAEFFALRRGRGAVIGYDLSPTAIDALEREGAVHRPIPIGARSPPFTGEELFIPAAAFDCFNDLSRAREIMGDAPPAS